MTRTPQDLSETPEAVADPLSDVLGAMHLSGTVLFRAAFREAWSVATPASCDLSGMLPFRTEHVIPFHLIAEGACWIAMPGREPLKLGAGDAVLLPYGDAHEIRGDGKAAPVPIGPLLPPPPWREIPVVAHGGNGPATHIVCGFVQCDELLFHPLLRHLPALLHVCASAVGKEWLARTIRHTIAESQSPAPGARSMLPRLTELMFVEILRDYLNGLSPDEAGWFAAFNDPAAGTALRLMHAEPFRAWDVESLARRAGVSRTILGERFRHFLGQPPMQYLVRWRLQLAAQRLKASDVPVKTVADESSYGSEAAFSRAFKRQFGLAPAEWRARQTQR